MLQMRSLGATIAKEKSRRDDRRNKAIPPERDLINRDFGWFRGGGRPQTAKFLTASIARA
jgi:hypothetical protein